MSSRRTNRQVSHHSLIALAVGLVACAEGVDDDRALGSPPRGTAGRSSGNGGSAGSAGNSASGGNAAGGGSAASGGSDHAALASVGARSCDIVGGCLRFAFMMDPLTSESGARSDQRWPREVRQVPPAW